MNRMALLAALPVVSLAAQDKVDFNKQIAPIFVLRCIECHGPEKDKGDLRLDRKELAFPAGDEELWTIRAGKPGESEMIHRVSLPIGDEDIMPEKGDPLTKAQQELLTRWVSEGADWPEDGDKVIADAIAAMELPMITFELPEVDAAGAAAIEAAIAKLREKGAVVQRVAADTEALDVNLSLLRDQVSDADLALLEPLAPRLVWLNLSRTGMTDQGSRHLAKLTQLRRLHAANTRVGDTTVEALARLTNLEYLNLYGTAITDDALPHLMGLRKLTRLYAWQTKVTDAGRKALQDHLAAVAIDLGDYAEDRMAAAAVEIADRERRNTPINTTCPVMAGKAINKDHFVLHEGRRVAFCCGKCKAKFEKDPAKYADKLPKVEAGNVEAGNVEAGNVEAGTNEAGTNEAGKDVPTGGAPAPVAQTADAKAPVNAKCPVTGRAVDAAQSVDYEGMRVAFCCGKCKAAFEKNPKKYAAKLAGK